MKRANKRSMPESGEPQIFSRFVHWISGRIRSEYESDRSLIESEGVVLLHRFVPARMKHRAFFYRAESRWWESVTVVVTRKRLRIYTEDLKTFADFSLTDPSELSAVDALLDDHGMLLIRVPRNVGWGSTWRSYGDREIVIKSPRAVQIVDLIRDAKVAALGHA